MRVFLADDEDLELFGIEKMLSDMPLELEICGTARNGEEGLRDVYKRQGKVAAVSYTESNPAMSFFGRLFK